MDRRNPPSQRPAATVSRPALRRMEAVTRGRRAPGDGAAHRDARTELSAWLVAGREAKGLSRDQVAKITRIQLRTIERLEEGRFDELPADVFVRGFIRGYARCVGLPVDEALTRYGSCGFAAAPVASAQAQALLESMSSLAPPVARSGIGRTPRILGEDAADGVGDAELVAIAAAVPMVVPMAAGTRQDLPAIPTTSDAAQVAAEAAPVDEPVDEAPVTPVAVDGPATVVAVTAEAAPSKVTRRRRKKGEVGAGPAVRDSRGRFVRRTGVMPAVDIAALGIDAEELAASDPASEPAIEIVVDADTAAPTAADLVAAAAQELAASIACGAAPAQKRTEVVPAKPVEVVPAKPVAAEPAKPVAAEPAKPVAAELEAVLAAESAPEDEVAPFATTTGKFLAMPPRTSGITVVPTLVIDDDDPEDAERAREERVATRKEADKGWRSFIPPALLDQQKGRQGGLTLAVIILLIVATLTLSYLMRRPSSAGEGITSRETPTLPVA